MSIENNTATKPFYNTTIPSDWKVKSMGNLFDFKNGINAVKENYGTGVKFINVMETIYNEFITADKIPGTVQITKEQKESYLVKNGDVLFNRTSETTDEIGLTAVYYGNEEVVFGGFVIRGRPIDKSITDSFKRYCFRSRLVRAQIIKSGQGAIRTNIGQGDLEKVEVPFPPHPEQRAIAHVLSLMDSAINQNNQLIAQKELQKKWLMQNLLTGKKRLKGFGEKWKVKLLEDVLIPISRPVDKPSSSFLALGIRSHGKGTFLKPDFEPSKIEMDTLFVVKENDLIVNITFAWEQAIAIARKKDDGALVSHRFPTFTFNPNSGVINYFRHFILQPKFKYLLDLISPGGAGRNRVLSKKDFLKLEVKIPSVEEQTAIAQVLQAADKEIQLLKTKTEKLREQKKGMMQQLLTGKKRLNYE